MRVGLRVDPLRLSRWHEWLISSLSGMPNCRVTLIFCVTPRPSPLSCLLAMELERLIYGLGAGYAIDRIDLSDLKRFGSQVGEGAEGCDIVIDLVDDGAREPACARMLTPMFNGVPGEIGAIAAVLGSGPVWVDVYERSCGGRLTARPAMSDRRVLVKALDGVLSSAVELLLKGLSEPFMTHEIGATSVIAQNTPPGSASAIARVATVLVEKAGALIASIAAGGYAWAVAYRLDEGASLLDGGQATFAVLQNDPRQFYADPFPFEHQGRRLLFVEQYSHATARGCIAVATIGKDGTIAHPRPVIEEPYHLSYPFVFRCDGQIWMIPESAAANRIDLYRAIKFPYHWKREGSILEGVAGYDATIAQHGGRLWMMAAMARWKNTSWDHLSVFYAKGLLGPWIAHEQNPILIDAKQSRSAGAMFTRSGQLMRPVQDCSRIYGGAIAISQVNVLTPAQFRQTTVGKVECGTLGCHTYNRSAGLEVIDIFGATRGVARLVATYARYETMTDSEKAGLTQTPEHGNAEPTRRALAQNGGKAPVWENSLTTSVIICAHSLKRWGDLSEAIESVRSLKPAANEIVVVIDHNRWLMERVRETFCGLVVVESREPPGLSGARNAGIAAARGDLLLFLDDDVIVHPQWLAHVLDHCRRPDVLGAMGRIEPLWLGRRPKWFPDEFLWVVGCTYRGFPEQTQVVRNLLGCSMAISRRVAHKIGGFNARLGRTGKSFPWSCEETEFCVRARSLVGGEFVFEPKSVVWHKVPESRLTPKYFWMRCYAEGRSKWRVSALSGFGKATSNERLYVLRTLPRGVAKALGEALLLDVGALGRAIAIVAGFSSALIGYIVGMAVAIGEAEPPPKALKNPTP
jgi:GT2 family glycosyltransferase